MIYYHILKNLAKIYIKIKYKCRCHNYLQAHNIIVNMYVINFLSKSRWITR